MIFLDKSSKRTKDENGFLTIKDNPIAVAGVFEYLHSELFEDGEDRVVKVYRDFEDLKSVKDKFSKMPIMFNHKWVGDEANQVDGAISEDIRIDEKNLSLISDLTIYNPELVEAIENDKIIELSPGYTGEVVEEKGRFNGQSYDYRQIPNITNHLAVVENGRAGGSLKIQDSKIKINEREDMKVEDKKFLDTLKRLLKFSDNEAEVKTEDSEEPKTVKSILDSDITDSEKVEQIRALEESKTEDEEATEKTEDTEEVEPKTEDEDKVEDSDEVVEKDDKAEEIAKIIKEEIEKRFSDSTKQLSRIQDAYDNVSAIIGTFKKDGMSANEIYKMGYEGISGKALSDGMDAMTAFTLASAKFNTPSTTFKDSKTVDSKLSSVLSRFN